MIKMWKNKNNVKFKDIEVGEEEGDILPPKPSSEADDNDSLSRKDEEKSNPKNSSTKLTSILKNSNKDKVSDVNKDSSIELTNHINDEFIKESENKKANKTDKEPNKQKKLNKNLIPNMKVEEDLVNLSDMGNGPEKPTIKTIYKKMLRAKKEKASQDDQENATPGQTSSKYTATPESKKSIESLKSKTKSKDQKSLTSPKESPSKVVGVNAGYNSDGISEYSEEFDQKDMPYKPQSHLINYDELQEEENFKIKRYKDAIYRG